MTARDYIPPNKEKSKVITWEKLKSGNREALGEIYDFYIDDLFVYGMHQKHDKGYVMDCIHDVFVDIYKYRNSLSNTDNVRFYLYKCLKRRIHRKKSWKIIPLQTDYNGFSKAEQRVSSISSEEAIIDLERTTEKNTRLAKAMESLTKRQKECILMRFTKDIPYEEIAQIMDVSVQTARTIVYRGIKSLREHSLTVIFTLIKIIFI